MVYVRIHVAESIGSAHSLQASPAYTVGCEANLAQAALPCAGFARETAGIALAEATYSYRIVSDACDDLPHPVVWWWAVMLRSPCRYACTTLKLHASGRARSLVRVRNGRGMC